MTNQVDYYQAVAGQPAVLARSAASIRAGLAAVELGPWRRGVLGIVSMGASSHAGHALVHRLGRYGRRAVNLSAADLLALGPAAAPDRPGPADGYLIVSEGGRSRETIEAARLLPAGTRLALTNAPDAPLSRLVDAVLDLAAGEDSAVYTVGYTTTLQAYGLLATALDGQQDGEDWTGLPERASAVLAGCAEPAAAAAAGFAGAPAIDVVAAAESFASAAEAALLLRESTRISAAAHETYQYLHGPMEPLTPRHACLVFGAGRELALTRYLVAAGVRTALVTTAPVAPEPGLTVLRIPASPSMSRAVLEMLPAQLLAGEVARLRGLGVDGFRHHQDDTKVPIPQ